MLQTNGKNHIPERIKPASIVEYRYDNNSFLRFGIGGGCIYIYTHTWYAIIGGILWRTWRTGTTLFKKPTIGQKRNFFLSKYSNLSKTLFAL